MIRRIVCHLASILALVLFAATMNAQQPSQPPDEPNQQIPTMPSEQDTNTQPTNAPPEAGREPDVVETPSQAEPPEPHLGHTEAEKPMTTYERRTLQITAAGVVAAVIVLIIQSLQLGELKRATDSSAISARAAEQGAKATLDAVNMQKLSNQQWLEGEWNAEAETTDDGREVQVGLGIKNPTPMSLTIKKCTIEVGSKAADAPGFSVFNSMDIAAKPIPIGPNGSFFALMVKLPWMTSPNDQGAFIWANVVFTDAFGDDSTTRFQAVVTWIDNRIKLDPSPPRTERNGTNGQDQCPKEERQP